MGFAICGMHYVGMQAANFRTMPDHMHEAEDLPRGVGI